MSHYFTFTQPIVQAIGLVSTPTRDGTDFGWIERKPIAAAILTLSQRSDGQIDVFHDLMSAVDEQEFPLPWMIEHELVAQVTTLISAREARLLVLDAAQQRFFVEPKVTSLVSGTHALDITSLVSDASGASSEAGLCRRLGIPRLDIDDSSATRIWTTYPAESRANVLCRHALAGAVSRLMLWANLMSVHRQEPGWFYETMLALRSWLDEREDDAPDLYAWGSARPIMRAVSFAHEYRRDLGRRSAGQDSDWPQFAPGLFHI